MTIPKWFNWLCVGIAAIAFSLLVLASVYTFGTILASFFGWWSLLIVVVITLLIRGCWILVGKWIDPLI
jgi:hypothetical protein